MTDEQRFDAWISGSTKVAVLYLAGSRKGHGIIDGNESPPVVDVFDEETFHAILVHRLHDVTDLVKLKGLTLEETKRALYLEIYLDDTLQLVRMILNPDEDEDICKGTVGELEDCLSDNNAVEQRLRNIFWSLPVPKEADLNKALNVTHQGKTPKSGKLFEQLAKQQPAIEAVYRAWDSIPTSLFGGEEESRQEFRVTMVRLGAFRQLAEGESFQTMLESIQGNPEANELLNFKLVMLRWQRAIEG